MTLIAVLLLGLQQVATRDEQCNTCHEDQAADVTETLHQKAGVGCVSCHGTDEIVNEKHKRTAAFRPGKLPQVAELCGSCHKGVLDAFRPTDHFLAASRGDGDPKRRSTCSACHEYHTTPAASTRTILPKCLPCHDATSHEVVEAKAFFQRLSEQGRAAKSLGDQLKRLAGKPGVRTFDIAPELEAVRADRRELHIAQHGLDWARLGTQADASAARANESYKMLADRERAFGRRYLGLGFFLGLLALCAVLVARRARTIQGAA